MSFALNPEKALILPNFFMIGVAKSGTTSLAQLIQRNSEIFVAATKEIDFFNWDFEYKKGIAYYSDYHFGKAHQQAIGEASVSYFTSEKVRDRIAQDIPASSHRFIVILRDPVKRAYSEYLMRRFRFKVEKKSFGDAVLEDLERRSTVNGGRFTDSYLWQSEYGTVIQSWKAKFPEGKFLFLRSDHLRADPAATYQAVVTFLGVESKLPETGDSFAMLDSPQSNEASATLLGINRVPAHLPEWVRQFAQKFTSYRFRKKVTHKIERFDIFLMRLSPNHKNQSQLPQLDKGLEYELRCRFASEMKLAAEITGLDLSDWLPSD